MKNVNREYAEVLVEQNINGTLDTAYVYGAAIGAGSDRLSLDHFDSTGYYLYDPRGSVTGITNEEGQIYQSYRYSVFGEITFGASQYENEYTYNGESYNPNIKSQYLRARYYCVGSPLNYVDPRRNMPNIRKFFWDWFWGDDNEEEVDIIDSLAKPISSTPTPRPTEAPLTLPQGVEPYEQGVLRKGGIAYLLEALQRRPEQNFSQLTQISTQVPIEEQMQAMIGNGETEQCDLQTWEYSYINKDGELVNKIWTLSDEEFVDSSVLTQEEITKICNEKNPGLVERGFDKSIYETANARGINPKIILATLAQEQAWCKKGNYDKAFGVGPGGEPISFEENSKGGLAKAIDTYLRLFNEGLAYEESDAMPTLLVNQDKAPYKETKAVFGDGMAEWQSNNPKYVAYME